MREFYNQSSQSKNNIVLAIIVEDGDKHAKLNIIIGDKGAQSKGCGTEALRLIVDYGFSKLNLHRLGLGVHEDNKAAIKAYEKAGFFVEGRYKDHFLRNGKYSDAICMAIINKNTT
jgi:RimJ/RimL family protein N-acetyltransferase